MEEKKVSRQYKWALKNPEKIKAYKAKYYKTEKAKKARKMWYAKNRERLMEDQRERNAEFMKEHGYSIGTHYYRKKKEKALTKA